MGYRLDVVDVLLDHGYTAKVPKFELEDELIDMTLDEALGAHEDAIGRKAAKQFLCNLPADGRVEYAEVMRLADEEGIPEKTLRRAKRLLGVVSEHEGFGKGPGYLLAAPASQ
jgi:hypothetical protein